MSHVSEQTNGKGGEEEKKEDFGTRQKRVKTWNQLREKEKEHERMFIKTNKTARTHVYSRCDKIEKEKRCRMN